MLSRSGSNWMISGERASADEVEAYVRALERAVQNTARGAQNNGQSTTQWSWKSFGWGLATAFSFWLISTAGGWGWFGRFFGGLFNMVRDLLALAVIIGIGWLLYRLAKRRMAVPSPEPQGARFVATPPQTAPADDQDRPTVTDDVRDIFREMGNWFRTNLDTSRGTRSPRR